MLYPAVKANCVNWKFDLGAPAAISRTGFVLWALQLPFRAKGSYFWRSSCHFEQRVRTLGAPVAILGKGFGLLVTSKRSGDNGGPPLGFVL